MKRINIANLKPGMVTAEDITSFNNTLILPKGSRLTDESITRLELYSIISIRVFEPSETESLFGELSEPETEQATQTEQTYSTVVQSSSEFRSFQSNFKQTVTSLKSQLNEVVERNTPINIQEMLHNTIGLIRSCKTSTNVFSMLHNMRNYDDLTFTHCLNVALICNVFSQWLNFSEEDRELATMCGLLHDIGKLAIPEDIIKKPSKLTDEEFDIIKRHPIEGYSILQNLDINEHIKNSALMHHERCDGSGYPLGLKGNGIDKFAKIVSIADVYDAMTAARVYRGPLCPFTVIDIFEKEGFHKYETQYILTFLENIVLTYMSNHVRLNDGQVGKIIFINKQLLSRPLISTANGFIDLAKHPELRIEAIV